MYDTMTHIMMSDQKQSSRAFLALCLHTAQDPHLVAGLIDEDLIGRGSWPDSTPPSTPPASRRYAPEFTTRYCPRTFWMEN